MKAKEKGWAMKPNIVALVTNCLGEGEKLEEISFYIQEKQYLKLEIQMERKLYNLPVTTLS